MLAGPSLFLETPAALNGDGPTFTLVCFEEVDFRMTVASQRLKGTPTPIMFF